MNILFLTITRFTTFIEQGIYTDLMRKCAAEGHQLYIVAPAERRFKAATHLKMEQGVRILNVKTLNIQKTNIIEKGLATLLLEKQFQKAIRKHFREVHFDLVMYSTPPITFTKIVREIKQRHKASSYLLLKDIFPQNAVDLHMMKRGGLLHRFFLHKEKALYKASDFIGCMSPANVSYILQHNNFMQSHQVEVNPNSLELSPTLAPIPSPSLKHNNIQLPADKTIFVYGGNLGKPQGIGFLLQTIQACAGIPQAYFLVIGSGTELPRIRQWFSTNKPANALLLNELPKNAYDRLVSACHVGLIFLDPRFTIPNYPSRLLSYLQNSMPVITATDPATDIGTIAEENGYGLRCLSGDIETMKKHIRYCCENPEKVKEMGQKGYEFLKNNYTVQHSYDIIMRHFQ